MENPTGFITRHSHEHCSSAFVATPSLEQTVIHATAGFGASSVIHTASLVELSADLPVPIEVVDDEAHVDRLLPILDEMLTGGALVTLERVRVLKYAAARRRGDAQDNASDCPLSRRHVTANGSAPSAKSTNMV